MTRTFQDECLAVQTHQFDLLVQRQKKYGRGNIDQGGILGCLIRAGDKLERLKLKFPALGITGVSNKDYPDESVEDAMLDLANYATIMLMLYRDTWGKPLALPTLGPAPPYENDNRRGTEPWEIDQMENSGEYQDVGLQGMGGRSING